MYSYSGASHGGADDQDRRRKIADLQREIMMTETDLKKVMNEKVVLESEERKLKKEIDSLRMELQDKERKTRSADQEINTKQAEISRLKKMLNVL